MTPSPTDNLQVGYLAAFCTTAQAEIDLLAADLLSNDIHEALRRLEYIRRQGDLAAKKCQEIRQGTPSAGKLPGSV